MSKIMGVTVGTGMNPEKVVTKTTLGEQVDRLSEEKVDKEDVVQIFGDNKNKIMSQASLNYLSGITKEEITVEVVSNNIIPPDSKAGRYDVTTGEYNGNDPSNICTEDFFPVEQGRTLYIYYDKTEASFEYTYAVIMLFYDKNDKFLSYTGLSQTDGRSLTVPINATKAHIYMTMASRTGMTMANLCLSYTELDGYEEYLADETVKYYVDFEKIYDGISDNVKNKLKPFVGKTIVNFGDSIFGNYVAPDDISSKLADLTGATVYNCGFGGTTLSKHPYNSYNAFAFHSLVNSIVNNDWSIQEEALETYAELPSLYDDKIVLLKNLDFNSVDIITIAYGTNDWNSGNPVDSENYPYNTGIYAGALRTVIESLLTAFPHLHIFLVSPIYRYSINDDGTFKGDSDSETRNDTWSSNPQLLTDFIEKMKEVAKTYHVEFIDNYYSLGINKFTREVYLSEDCVHPTLEGRHRIAEHIAKALY